MKAGLACLLTYLLTYLLNQWYRILFEKLIVTHLINLTFIIFFFSFLLSGTPASAT